MYFISLKNGGYVHCNTLNINLYDDGKVFIVPFHGQWRLGELDCRAIKSVEHHGENIVFRREDTIDK